MMVLIGQYTVKVSNSLFQVYGLSFVIDQGKGGYEGVTGVEDIHFQFIDVSTA